MNDDKTGQISKNNTISAGSDYIKLSLLSLGALISTFVAANVNQDFPAKFLIFITIVFLFLFCCAVIYFRQTGAARNGGTTKFDVIKNNETESRLLALEEASRFFGASLKFPDMFRLAASRVNELIPFSSCAFFLLNENSTKLKIVCAVGENSRNLLNFEINSDQGLAGKTLLSQTIRYEEKLISDKKLFPADALQNLESGLAVPLFSNGDVFGVLSLYGNRKINFDRNSVELIEAVGTRIAPLFISSMTFERSLNNAMTDTLTCLPNERAFYLILENQIAESQRHREERNLTVLTVDIKNFTELNQKFGHATGDRILTFAANNIKGQLRQMDFLARSVNDEFLIVLPTASGKVSMEIIARIEQAFIFKQFEISRQEKIHLNLNFGAASFGKDGETARQLLDHAQLRKQQAKTGQSGNVIWFPKEFVN